jgi:hypothetical protein
MTKVKTPISKLEAEKKREYFRNWQREKRKDPAYRAKLNADKKHRVATRLESFVSMALSGAKSRAKIHNLKFNIDSKYVTKLVLECNGKCQATGLNLSTITNCPYKASLDRIDSNKGYVKGNVRVVATMFNFMKQDYSDLQFAQIAKAFLKNNGLQTTRKS